MIRHFQPNAISETAAPFSQVVLDDNYAYLSGLVAADFPEGLAVLGDVGNETRAIWNAIESSLKEVGLDLGQIVRVDVHLANLEDFDAMDAAYRDFSENGGYPARTTTESNRLFGGSLVEITCIAKRK